MGDDRQNDYPFARHAFTPDWRRVLSAAEVGGGWYLWETDSGRLLRRWEGAERLTALAVDPAGRRVACGDDGGVVSIRNLQTGKARVRLAPDEYRAVALAFTPDGRHLAVLGNCPGYALRYTVRLVEAATGKLRRRFWVEDAFDACLAPDAGGVAVSGDSGGLWLWDVASGKPRRLLPPRHTRRYRLSFSPDGQTLLGHEDGEDTLRRWDVKSGKGLGAVKAQALRHVGRVALSPDGSTLAATEAGNAVRLWDAATGRPRRVSFGHARPPEVLRFTPDGKSVLSGQVEDGVFRWEVATGRLLARAPLRGVRSWDRLALSPDGRKAAATVDWSESFLLVWDGRAWKRVAELGKNNRVTDLAFSPGGRALGVLLGDGKLLLWDVAAGRRRRVVDLRGWVKGSCWVAFSPDGRTLAVGEGPLRVSLWDAVTGKHLGAMEADARRWKGTEFGETPWRTFFSPDGKALYASSGGHCVVWDVGGRREAEPLREEEWQEYPPRAGAVDLSPDGRLLARFGRHNGPGLWETASGQRVLRFEGVYHSAAFGPEGRTLATGCAEDCSVLVWDLGELFRRGATAGGGTPWEELASTDAPRAYGALWRLAGGGRATVAMLREKLRPVAPADSARLKRLVNDLGHPEYPARRKAESALAELREAARGALGEARKRGASLEVRLRAGRLPRRLAPRSPERLREVRAVQALEYLGTAEARRLLRDLAGGIPEARLTREAKSALRRLEGRTAAKP